jgi:signal transduction histidine kinase
VTLQRLKWISIGSVLGFIVVLEVVRRALYPYLESWQAHLVMSATVFTGSLFFFGGLFHVIERIQTRLERKNRELLALHAAALDIYGDLALDVVLQKVVDQAVSLLDARYGALSVIDQDNRIEQFITCGITPEQRARIGDLPVGHGLLGVVLHEGQRLRLPDLTRDPRSVGFPPQHPRMHSLLAVPIVCKGPFRGNLYLAEKRDAREFSDEDEGTLVRFATIAAIAIDSTYLHDRLNSLAVAEERLRIAHEMHDGLAQVLAYVNTKAQAVREHIRAGRGDDASRHLDQLASAAREVYGDVREGITGLRAASVTGRTVTQALREFIASWEAQTGIPCTLTGDGELKLTSGAELQLQRIVQEALANVRKHAGARNAEVSLQKMDSRLVVTIRDDGTGFNPEQLRRGDFPRYGLATMRERAESIGGTVNIDSAPGQGTRVTVEVPLRKNTGT